MLFFSLHTADRRQNDSTAGRDMGWNGCRNFERDMGWNGCRNFEVAANSIPGVSLYVAHERSFWGVFD